MALCRRVPRGRSDTGWGPSEIDRSAGDFCRVARGPGKASISMGQSTNDTPAVDCQAPLERTCLSRSSDGCRVRSAVHGLHCYFMAARSHGTATWYALPWRASRGGGDRSRNMTGKPPG